MSKQVFSRSQFVGMTDRYARQARGNFNVEVTSAVEKGTSPKDIIGSVLGDLYVRQSQTRLNAYDESWRAFRGEHFESPVDRHLTKTVVNFVKNAIRKRATWAVGRGLVLKTIAGNEMVTDVLSSIWKLNKASELLRSAQLTSLVCGDSFLYFDVCRVDSSGKDLPTEKQYVRITQLNPAYVFPYWNESDPSKLSAVVLNFPAMIKEKDSETPSERIFSLVATPDRIVKYIDGEQISSDPNPIGLIPVVHIANERIVDTMFGSSLALELLPLNKGYNETLHSIRRVVDYHGEPTTIVYGTRLSTMERGVNKVWSNLPKPGESEVVNLELRGDLEASYRCLETLESQIYRTARTPKICFDSDGLAVSNTSGVAMALLFQPLVEATIEAQDVLKAAISAGNEIIAAYHSAVLGEDLRSLADVPDRYLDIEVEFKSILPRDEQAEIDMALKRKEMGVWSQAEVIRRVGDIKDTERLAMELAADKLSKWIESANNQRALEGQPLNFAGAFVGSPFLSEDLLDVASNMPSISSDSSSDGSSTAAT